MHGEIALQPLGADVVKVHMLFACQAGGST